MFSQRCSLALGRLHGSDSAWRIFSGLPRCSGARWLGRGRIFILTLRGLTELFVVLQTLAASAMISRRSCRVGSRKWLSPGNQSEHNIRIQLKSKGEKPFGSLLNWGPDQFLILDAAPPVTTYIVRMNYLRNNIGADRLQQVELRHRPNGQVDTPRHSAPGRRNYEGGGSMNLGDAIPVARNAYTREQHRRGTPSTSPCPEPRANGH